LYLECLLLSLVDVQVVPLERGTILDRIYFEFALVVDTVMEDVDELGLGEHLHNCCIVVAIVALTLL
jgi:hypothetical protein